MIVGSAWHIDADTKQSAAFTERYHDLHGVDPDQFSEQAHAGMQILAAAAEQIDEFTPETARDALAMLGRG